MSITRLEEKSLNAYLGLSAWMADAEAGSGEDINTALRDRIDLERTTIRSVLARSDSGFLVDALFSLRAPVEIAALIGRVTAEQYSILQGNIRAWRSGTVQWPSRQAVQPCHFGSTAWP